jgi:hypothetical protein
MNASKCVYRNTPTCDNYITHVYIMIAGGTIADSAFMSWCAPCQESSYSVLPEHTGCNTLPHPQYVLHRGTWTDIFQISLRNLYIVLFSEMHEESGLCLKGSKPGGLASSFRKAGQA